MGWQFLTFKKTLKTDNKQTSPKKDSNCVVGVSCSFFCRDARKWSTKNLLRKQIHSVSFSNKKGEFNLIKY